MDVLLFVKIINWIVAIVGTIHALLGAGLQYYYHMTPRGKLEVALMQYRSGVTPAYRWTPLIAAIVAWVAIASFK